MERKRKIVKVHYSFALEPDVGICGIRTRKINFTNLIKEVTCGNCLKVIFKRKSYKDNG